MGACFLCRLSSRVEFFEDRDRTGPYAFVEVLLASDSPVHLLNAELFYDALVVLFKAVLESVSYKIRARFDVEQQVCKDDALVAREA